MGKNYIQPPEGRGYSITSVYLTTLGAIGQRRIVPLGRETGAYKEPQSIYEAALHAVGDISFTHMVVNKRLLV